MSSVRRWRRSASTFGRCNPFGCDDANDIDNRRWAQILVPMLVDTLFYDLLLVDFSQLLEASWSLAIAGKISVKNKNSNFWTKFYVNS